MRNTFTYLFLGCVMGVSSLAVNAQTPLVVDRGATVELKAVDGYQSYQWQVSSDKKHFVDLPEGHVQNMNLKVYAPGSYRVRVTDADKKTSYIDVYDVTMQKVSYVSSPSVSGGAHGFVETRAGVPDARGIDIPEDRVGNIAGTTKQLTNWSNGDAMAVWYFNHPKSIVDTEMYLKVKSGAHVSFRVKVVDPDHGETALAENIIAIEGTGEEQCVNLVGADFPRKAYYRYQLECLNGWKNIIDISKFKHYSTSSVQTYKPAYLSSPSVHLNSWRSSKSGAPRGASYDWCYQEVMMPKESDIKGTYVMSLGVLNGYMGIQMNGWENGKSLHEVIFSMWDAGDTDKNPNLPDNLRAKVVDHNEKVTVSPFGNEGTGMKSFLSGHHWECGTFVQFITNCRKEIVKFKEVVNGREVWRQQTNILVSAWFNAQDGKGWQYMSTLRLPKHSEPFDSWYSFLENYNYPTGQALRKGFYKNGYGRSKNRGQWYHFNCVNFGHTDGGDKIGARNDFSQGKSDEIDGAFFMTTGGFVSSNVTENMVPLNEDNIAVDTINLSALEERVELAIAREKAREEMEENFNKNKMDKKGWKVIAFSSQETGGEGNNGRASQIIDGDNKSYWHSQWTGGGSHYPHYLTVDMQEVHNISGMEITMGDRSDRRIKAFNLFVSTDNRIWKNVYSDKNAPNQKSFHFMLPQAEKARYFKLQITDGRANDGDHVTINEIEVTKAVDTGIHSIEKNDLPFVLTAGKGAMSVMFSKEANDVEISLHRVDGANFLSEEFSHLRSGEIVILPMQEIPSGVYIFSCKMNGKKYAKALIWRK